MSAAEKSGHEHEEFVIHVDRKQYKVPGPTISGAQVRQLPDPPIGVDFDLYEEQPGGEDMLIEDATLVELKNGLHFFSVPKTINPGR
jgi:hypothetical protein